MGNPEHELKFPILRKEQPDSPNLLSAAVPRKAENDVLPEMPCTPGPRHGIYFE